MSFPRRTVAASLFLAAACLGPPVLPAAAQGYGWGNYNYPPPPPGYGAPAPYAARQLGPDEITDRLEDLGFEEVGQPRYTGQGYEVDASTRNGRRIRLVVDAVRGIVLRRYALGRTGGRDPDGADVAGFTRPQPLPYGGARAPSPYDEMPDLPEARGPARREAALPRGPGRPVAPSIQTPTGPLPAPADARLSPGPAPGSAPEGRPLDLQANQEPPPVPTKPGSVQGLNPARSAPSSGNSGSARRSAAPAPATSPAAPAPKLPATGAAPGGPESRSATAQPADAAPRKPVRVIGGVTPLNNGQQATPGPQNGVDGAPPK